MTKPTRIRRHVAAGLLVGVLAVAGLGCHDIDEPVRGPDNAPPVDPNRPPASGLISVAGDWDVIVNETTDTCDIDLPQDAREILRISQSGVSLGTEIADDGSVCGGKFSLLLRGTTASLDRTRTVTDDVGDCTLRVRSQASIAFTQASFTATERNLVTWVSGDCDGFTGQCSWNLEATGTLCTTCSLTCSSNLPAGQERLGGPFGYAAMADVFLP